MDFFLKIIFFGILGLYFTWQLKMWKGRERGTDMQQMAFIHGVHAEPGELSRHPKIIMDFYFVLRI